jgi:hypothetical protein
MMAGGARDHPGPRGSARVSCRCEGGAKNHPGPGGPGWSMRCDAMKGPGEDRLSRRRHYHGPGGLNGRVRDGNGWDPAGMGAGKAAGGRLRPRRSHWRWFDRLSHNPGAGVAHSLHDGSLTGLRHGGRTWTRPAAGRPRGGGGAATDRGGQVARLLGLVRCGGRPPCTPSPSTWSSSRSLRRTAVRPETWF